MTFTLENAAALLQGASIDLPKDGHPYGTIKNHRSSVEFYCDVHDHTNIEIQGLKFNGYEFDDYEPGEELLKEVLSAKIEADLEQERQWANDARFDDYNNPQLLKGAL